jgi:hypothetical protein
MVLGFCIALMLIMRIWPETPLARTLHFHLVERPTAWVARTERSHLVYSAAILALLMTSGQVVALFGSAELALAFAWDLSLYLDAVLASYVAVAVTRLRAARTWISSRITLLSRRSTVARVRDRSPRSKVRAQSRRAPANDENGSRAGHLRLAA